MSIHLAPETLTFVWQPNDSLEHIRSLKKSTKCNTIQDLKSLKDPTPAMVEAANCSFSVRLTWPQLRLTSVQEFLGETGFTDLWVECLPEIDLSGQTDFTHEIKALLPKGACLITGDVELITAYFEAREDQYGLALKGTEAVGFSGVETALSLLSLVEYLAGKHSFKPEISVWGGIATAEAAAAFIYSGVKHIVFEHLHLLTNLSVCAADPRRAERLTSLQISHARTLPVAPKTSFRVFDKGNSQSVKEIAALSRKTAGENPAATVAAEIHRKVVELSQSDLAPDQLIPVGIETAFASAFTSTYGRDTITAITGFRKDIEQLLVECDSHVLRLLHSPLTREFSCRYPFIQGAMACITDSPQFALKIAKGGGLPTIALGIKNIAQLERDLEGLQETMADHSYGVNVITLAENPHRDDQLAWIKKNKPPFVVISAGSPLFAKELQDQGLTIIYVTSDEHLLQLAWENNIRYVVCEGHEAGGHVGTHSTLTLAQSALLIRRNNDGFQQLPIILAGGMVDGATTTRAALLGAAGIQLGTAYLATREIVECQALDSLYQKMVIEAPFGATAVTGQLVGLPVRSLFSPIVADIQTVERDLVAAAADEDDIRRRLETMTVGSLTIAARAKLPGKNEILPEERCYREGQYMCGAIAGGLAEVCSIQELHERLANTATPMVFAPKYTAAGVPQGSKPTPKESGRVAITGMAIVNSLGNSPEEIWQASAELRSGVSEVPQSRWRHEEYFSPKVGTPYKTYCRAGGFIALDISRKELGISPHDFRTMTFSSKLTFWLAHQAIRSSGILEADIAKDRIGVIVAQNSGETAGTINDLTITVSAPEIARSIVEKTGIDPARNSQLIDAIRGQRLSIDDTTLLGRLSCTSGGYICNKYNFQGPSFAVTAACATGLVALYNAVQLIRNDILDVAIIGGGEELLHPASFLEFSALGALAGRTNTDLPPAAASRPFDAARDGMVLGEGGAMLVLERQSLAASRGAHVHAYITGVGASNNNLGMIESVAETQQLAIIASLTDADYPPSEVDMIECHATATPTGDIEEVKALKAVFPNPCETVLTSFKSQIGHTLGTSGLNSLIRGVMAMQANVYPPTINYDTPDSHIDLESWGFNLCHVPTLWPHRSTRPRRFQVNGFGFGGANYVVQLEQADWSPEKDETEASETYLSHISIGQQEKIPAGIGFYETQLDDTTYKVGAAGTDFDQQTVKNLLAEHLHQNKTFADNTHLLKGQGVFAAAVKSPRPIALLFAGQGTHYKQMGMELYHTFPTMRKWMDRVAALADFDILEIMFKNEEADLRRTVWQQPALFVLEYALYQQLKSLNIAPRGLAGHSMGELTALAVAEVFTFEDAFRIIARRAACMQKAGTMVDDPGSMMAIDVPPALLEELIEEDQDLYITNLNSPHQTVIGGSTRAINVAQTKLEKQKLWNHILPVSMAFHSPIMRVIRDELGDYLANIDFQPPRIPVISNTTRLPYPDDGDEIKNIIISHLEAPVHWQDNVSYLRRELDIDCFVEVGPQDTLCRLLGDIEPGCTGIPTCSKEGEAQAFREAAAQLFSLGHMGAPGQKITLERRKVLDPAAINLIVQQEINTFALQGVETYLKPAIVKRIQQQIDPSFRATDLATYFNPPSQSTDVASPMLPVAALSSPGPDDDKKTTPSATDTSTVDRLIGIIMDATGYERSEIEPHMDIRQDLSIRSSRLPIIMDSVEKVFAITIRIEEFIGIKTIGDFAAKIDEVIDTQGGQQAAVTAQADKQGQDIGEILTGEDEDIVLKRLVPQTVELPPAAIKQLAIERDGHIVIASFAENELRAEAQEYLENTYNARVSQVLLSCSGGKHGLDITDYRATEAAVEKLSDGKPLTGLVLITGQSQAEVAEVSTICAGLFLFLQGLIRSDKKTFGLHLRISTDESPADVQIGEGFLGFLLCAHIEYQSLLLRSILVKDLPDMHEIFDICLNTNQPLIELLLEGGTVYTRQFHNHSLELPGTKTLQLSADDVLVISAGARGITARIIEEFAPFGCTLILLGRTHYDDDIDYLLLDEERLADAVKDRWPGLGQDEFQEKFTEVQIGREIHAQLDKLRRMGLKALYRQCDISDIEQVGRTFGQIREKYNRISGIIHGAAVLRDGFIPMQSADDVRQVGDVKLQGLVNMVQSCAEDTLRFIVGFSSIAAITGNIGQANYCCANRAMAAYLQFLNDHKGIVAKTLWLPPVEGAGMADDPEVKDLIRLKIGEHAFVSVAEVSAVVIRELFLGRHQDSWIVPLRQLPAIDSILLEKNLDKVRIPGWYDSSPMTMIDSVNHVDYDQRSLRAERHIRQQYDLWINDHKPFTSLKHPIASAIMIIESFFEAATLHSPHLHIQSLHNITFHTIMECPPEKGVKAVIECLTTTAAGEDCKVSITMGKEQQRAEKRASTVRPFFTGEALLSCREPQPASLTIEPFTTVSPLLTKPKIQELYHETSGLTGRYQVLETICECTPSTISATMIYPVVNDFAEPAPGTYNYPHYLLEGLMQIASFHSGIIHPDKILVRVPIALSELHINGSCRQGDTLLLRATLQEEREDGQTLWLACGYTSEGQLLLRAEGLTMQWIN